VKVGVKVSLGYSEDGGEGVLSHPINAQFGIKDFSKPVSELDGDLLSASRPGRLNQGNRASGSLSRC
jgi:hypothetical protein